METTTKNDDVIEVITELTVSDVKTLDDILDTCLDSNIFADASVSVVKQLSEKLKQLVISLEHSS